MQVSTITSAVAMTVDLAIIATHPTLERLMGRRARTVRTATSVARLAPQAQPVST